MGYEFLKMPCLTFKSWLSVTILPSKHCILYAYLCRYVSMNVLLVFWDKILPCGSSWSWTLDIPAWDYLDVCHHTSSMLCIFKAAFIHDIALSLSWWLWCDRLTSKLAEYLLLVCLSIYLSFKTEEKISFIWKLFLWGEEHISGSKGKHIPLTV
jgi:hypothetical protein